MNCQMNLDSGAMNDKVGSTTQSSRNGDDGLRGRLGGVFFRLLGFEALPVFCEITTKEVHFPYQKLERLYADSRSFGFGHSLGVIVILRFK